MIDQAGGEIHLLQEYRTRLIADVVTGQLDVREAARNLPDESDDLGDATILNEATDEIDHDPDDFEGEDDV